MKLIFGIIVGFFLGYQLGRRAVGGPEETAEARAQGRRLVGGAARIGATAVRRARASIQSRLSEPADADWN